MATINKIKQFVKLLNGKYKNATLLRHAGYRNDQNGILNRYYREHKNWQPHLDNTKQFVIQSANSVSHRKTVAVLGSGWLLDVPIEELCNLFDEVHLFDIIHPEPIKHKVRKFKNVKLVNLDLTGGLVALASQCDRFDQFIENMDLVKPQFSPEPYSLIVSLNLLNQLDILLCDYLIKKFKLKEEQLIGIRKNIQANHLKLLPQSKSCLITDYAELTKTVAGDFFSEKELVFIPLPKAVEIKEWEWLFDTHQLYHKNFNTTFRVKAIRF